MRIALRTSLDMTSGGLPDFSQMRPAMQKAYRRAAERFSARSADGHLPKAIVPKLSSRVIINGREFGSAIQMPPEWRRFYEEALASAVPLGGAIRAVVETERANFIKRTVGLSLIAAGLLARLVYVWSTGL